MDSRARDPKFFVVGGPVQPGRDCYLQRAADAELYGRLSEGEYCHVLAQRQTGKTSLAASTARKLRSSGNLVAIVDLTQASEEDPSENAGRWYYSIAYRIVRDLRIKSDVQAWWAERGGLTNLQRLREFFQEVVLEETTEPVVIIFDRIEATIGEPIAQDLFSAVRACYDARATDVKFQRLVFAMFGSGGANEFVKNVQGSPFEISTSIALPDFSPQEIAGLTPGLGEPLDDPELLVRRVWSWTRGHPYLSQKVFRGLSRRKGEDLTVATVDELVHTQFLAAQTIDEDPHLSAIAERLLGGGKKRAPRLNLYGRIRKGVDVMLDKSSEVQRELLTAGLVSVGEHDELRVRNEIYSMVFGTRWVNHNLPFGIKGLGIAVVIIIAIIGVPIWYTEILPRPYVQALSAAKQDDQVAADAYQGMSQLPGYRDSAERLYTGYLVRRAGLSSDLTEFTRVKNRLIALPGGAERGLKLQADFWEQQARLAAHEGSRDRALIALLEALQIPNERRRSWAGELIGADYRNLLATWHTGARLQAVRVNEEVGLVTLLDISNQARTWNINGERPRLQAQLSIVAEEWLELTDRRLIEVGGGAPKLYVQTLHPQPEQVEVSLRAPSGQFAATRLSNARRLDANVYEFSLSAFDALSALQGDELLGNWRLSLTDSEQGVSSELLSWGLRFNNEKYVPDERYVPQPIPEPRASENAESRLGPAGRLALSWPLDPETRGSVLVWDVADDAVMARIPRSPAMIDARFVLNGERFITLEERRLAVWDSSSGRQIGQIPLTSARLPVISDNGRYAVINTLRPDQSPAIVIWDLQRLQRVGKLIKAENAGPVDVANSGRLLAIGGRDPVVRVWNVATGELIHELEHGAPLRTVVFDPLGDWLVSDDLSSTFRVWKLQGEGSLVGERIGSSAWAADFSADSSRLLFGSSDRAFRVMQLPSGHVTSARLRQSRRGLSEAGILMLGSRNLAITTNAARTVKLWNAKSSDPSPVFADQQFSSGMRAALSSDGSRIAIGSADGTVTMGTFGVPGWIGLDAGAQADSLRQVEVTSLAFSDDRKLLASATLDGRVQIWNAAAGTPIEFPIVHPDGGAQYLLFIEAGTKLVSASRREVIVTDVTTGQVLSRLRIQANHPKLSAAADAGEIFIADDLNGVTQWNWKTDVAERIVDGEYRIRTLVVSADGERMITASDDRILTLWDLAERKPLEQTVKLAGKADNMWILANGRLVVQAGYWLQSIGIYPNGLKVRSARLLPEAPAALSPGSSEDTVYVLYPPDRSRQLNFAEMFLPESSAPQIDGLPAEVRAYWQDRLSLTLDKKGRVRPRQLPPLTLSSSNAAEP